MRITILTAGSRGDVQPYVALGAGLVQAGHQVRIPAPPIFRDLIQTAGLEFVPTTSLNPHDLIYRPDIQRAVKQGNQLLVLRLLLKESRLVMESLLQEFWELSQGSQLLITSGAFFLASESAEKLDVPWLVALPAPYGTTRMFPNPFFANGPVLGSLYNRLTHMLFEQMLWQSQRVAINTRRKKLGLRPHHLLGPFSEIHKQQIPFLIGVSPSVISPPMDWSTTHHMTGYWFVDQPDTWQPPTELTQFLAAGPPPICIGFGSMVTTNPKRTTDLIINALQRSKQRGIILKGWGSFGTREVPDTIYVTDSIPHAWLFPQASAVVHHGGAGTTAAGLRAGIPALITPVGGDQFFWQNAVVRLGVGPKLPRLEHLTTETLVQAITQAVSDGRMRTKAMQLGAKVRSENGIRNAVDIIHHYAQPYV